MSEELFTVGGVRVTVTGIYGTASALVLILFTVWWLLNRKKRTGLPIFAGQVMNGVGFGLLPALAVLKAFQDVVFGQGAEVLEPLPHAAWLSVEGHYMPARIEMAAALACFLVLCLWLILRKDEFPDNGDLILIAVCLWAAIRLVTEDFRAEPNALFRYTSCGTILFALILWTERRARAFRAPLRTAADLLSVCACIAINLVTAEKILTVGSAIGDFAVRTGSALLALVLTLLSGSDLRRHIKNAARQEAAQQNQPMSFTGRA